MPKISIKKGSTWYTAKKLWINKAGTWHKAKKMWIKKGGAWQLVTFLEPTLAGYYVALSGGATEVDMSFESDGSVGSTVGAQADWLSAVEAGNGADFWVRFNLSTGGASMPGKSFGTWYQMSSSVLVNLSGPPDSTTVSSGTYDVSDNGGSTTIGSGSWVMTLNE